MTNNKNEADLNETIRQIEDLAEDRQAKFDTPTPASCEAPTTESPMLVKRLQKNNKTGGIDFTLSLTMDQSYVLLNFAIMFLMSQGLAQFQDQIVEAGQAKDNIELGEQLH